MAKKFKIESTELFLYFLNVKTRQAQHIFVQTAFGEGGCGKK